MDYNNFSKAKEIDIEIAKLKCVKNSLSAFYDDVNISITTLKNDTYKIDVKKSIIKKDFEEFIKKCIKKLDKQFRGL